MRPSVSSIHTCEFTQRRHSTPISLHLDAYRNAGKKLAKTPSGLQKKSLHSVSETGVKASVQRKPINANLVNRVGNNVRDRDARSRDLSLEYT